MNIRGSGSLLFESFPDFSDASLARLPPRLSRLCWDFVFVAIPAIAKEEYFVGVKRFAVDSLRLFCIGSLRLAFLVWYFFDSNYPPRSLDLFSEFLVFARLMKVESAADLDRTSFGY
jgi:hypothetical protein